ncbi:transposable element Tcb1 transposase [Trichonephila clavipes]|nr:transposable element Tcb1 transposase [Trichonephila clavipes]
MSRRKQRSAFDQVSEFDRGRIVTYRDCGLSFKEIGSRVGRNQTTVIRKSEWSVRKTSIACLPLTQNHRRLRGQWCGERRMLEAEWNEAVFTDESRICLKHHDGRIRVWRHRGERMLNSCVMHRHTGPTPSIMVWDGIGYHSRTPLVRIAGFFVIYQIELFPWPARSLDLSPIEYMWSMIAQQLTQLTPPAATPDQLWQRVEAAWSSVPQKHI